jgi:hypothetical protein
MRQHATVISNHWSCQVSKVSVDKTQVGLSKIPERLAGAWYIRSNGPRQRLKSGNDLHMFGHSCCDRISAATISHLSHNISRHES